MNAPRSAFVSFRTLKERVSIKDILDHYGLTEGLVPRGTDTLSGPCPVHKGRHPSQFRVSLAKNCWNCFGPCAGGNILDLVAQLEQVSLAEAARLIESWFPGTQATAPREPKRPAPEWSQPEGTSALGDIPRREKPAPDEAEDRDGYMNPVLPFERLKNLDFGHAYLRGDRGFDRATLEYFGVGFCTKGMHRGRIAIPVHNPQGELVSYVGYDRETGQYHYHEAFRPDLELFNAHRMGGEDRATEVLVLTIDYFDVLRLHEAGYRKAVALPSETLSDRQLGLLAELVGEGGKLTLVVTEGYPRTFDALAALAGRLFVRLVVTETRLSDFRNAAVRDLFAG